MQKFYLDDNNRLWYKLKTIKGTYDWNNDGDVYYDEFIRYVSLDGESEDYREGEFEYVKELTYLQAREWLHNLLDGYFIPSSTTLDKYKKGEIDGYTDPTHDGKYHYSLGTYKFIKGGLTKSGTEKDRQEAIEKEVSYVMNGLDESKFISNSLVLDLVKTGKSVKSFRKALMEASHNFVSGSLADIVFKFYKSVLSYYKDLLIYQFQLYSDVPKYVLNLESIKVLKNDNMVDFYLFSKGKGTDLSKIQNLNDIPFGAGTEITYKFILAPELKNLVAQTKNNINKSLFSKVREISVPFGDGSYISCQVKPEWDDLGVTLVCNGIVKDNSNQKGLN